MFKKKENQHEANDEMVSGSINLIGIGTVIEGNVICKGDIRVDGQVVGNVSSKSKVVIGSTGQIKGDIYSQNADISGSHFGSSHITDLLFLKSTSKVNGNINTGKLVVESGAVFTGNCNMGVIAEKPIKVDVNFRERQPKEDRASEEIFA